MKYKYYLFDWDGCLADSLSFWLNAYKEVFSEYGVYPQDQEIIAKVFGKPQGPVEFGIEDPLRFKKVVHALVRERMKKELKLHEGVKETLVKLKENQKHLAIATSSKRNNIQGILEREEILDMFDLIVTADDVQNVKPDPEILFKIIDALGADKSEVVMIGDSDADILAGRAAGVSTILFYPTINEEFYNLEELKKNEPDYVIKYIDEVVSLTKS